MVVNSKQIDALYEFTRQHFVEHYDLQTELVDHLANDIEQIWQTQPNLSFEEARDKSFKKFGIFGFMDIVEKRRNAMTKRYYKYLKDELVQWFGWPKFFITLFIFFVCLYGFSSNHVQYFFISIYTPLIGWIFYRSYRLNRTYKKRKLESNKKWMLENIIFKQGGAVGAIIVSQFPTYCQLLSHTLYNQYLVLALSTGTTLLILCFYISYYLLPEKADKLLEKTYPEYKSAVL